MTVEFHLPNLGEGVASADVAELLVKEGDAISAEQPVMELETEKAVMEVPCPHGGTIQKVHIAEGETLKVGQLLLTIETADSEAKPKEAPQKPASGEKKSQTSKAVPAEQPAPQSKQASRPQAETAGKAAQNGGVVDFQLPNLGEGVESADVAEVLVKVGDEIAVDQPVMELETEKAVMEVPSPFAGRVESIAIKSGDKVRVGQQVMRIQSSAAGAQAPAPSAAKPQPAAEPSRQPEPRPAREAAPAEKPAERQVPARVGAEIATDAQGDGRTPVPAAPSTRRLARKLGVELRSVRGSGPGGRITQEDVQAHVRGLLQHKQLPALATRGGGLAAGSLAPPPLPDFTRYGMVERQPLNKIARTAAENLTVSWNVIPHVTQHDRADITELEAARKRFGQRLKNGPKVTMTAVAIKALTTCLQTFPKFNSSLDPETNELVLKRYYHIGCAVDTPNGLLVPVVKDCDQKSILDIAAEITDLAEKARDRKLSMDNMQGATCTVTNLGGIGGTAFTPIVNYPEVCILGMARSQTELQLVDGQVKERLMLPLALSYDHRVINGADAARFVAMLCQMLSDPFQLLSAI